MELASKLFYPTLTSLGELLSAITSSGQAFYIVKELKYGKDLQ